MILKAKEKIVGIVLGILMILITLFFFWRWHRNRIRSVKYNSLNYDILE